MSCDSGCEIFWVTARGGVCIRDDLLAFDRQARVRVRPNWSLGRKTPLLTAPLSTIPPVAPASKFLGSPGCLIDLSCYSAVPRSVAGWFGAPDDVWGSLF